MSDHRARRTHALTVIIDGPSGAGKTWLAEHLARNWPSDRAVEILHMDDLYRGWTGLAEASRFVSTELAPTRAAGLPVHWQRWDWLRGELAEWHEIPAESDLIIEGCGSLTERSAEIAHVRIWIDAEPESRKALALARGEADYEKHWDMWDAQFELFVSRNTPRRHASLVVSMHGVD